MADFNVTGYKAFNIAADIAQYVRVTYSAAAPDATSAMIVAIAGLNDVTIGVTTRAEFVPTAAGSPLAVAGNKEVTVRLMSAQGTIPVSLYGTVTAGGALYAAASGQVSNTQTSNATLLGYAMQTIASNSGNNAIVEMLPL